MRKSYTSLNTHKKKSANPYLGYIKVALYRTSLTNMGNYNTWIHQGWWYNRTQKTQFKRVHALLGIAHIDSLVQDCSNTIASALELLQSCTKPYIYNS